MEGRDELGAWAAISFGLALAIVSEVVDRRGWPPTIHILLLSIGVGAAIIGIQRGRSLPSDRPRPSRLWRGVAAVVPALFVAVAAYGLTIVTRRNASAIALHDRDLGGVTIALPDGDEQPNPQGASRVMIQEIGGRDLSVIVLWQTGTFGDSNARAIVTAGATRVGSTPEPLPDDALAVGGGIQHRSFRIVADAGTMFATVFPCGPRIFAVFAAGDEGDGLASRILASVRCHPTELDVPALVELPAGWRQTGSGPLLRYEHAGEVLLVSRMDIVEDANMQGVIDATAEHLGTDVRLGPRADVATASGTRPVWTGTMTTDGRSVPVQISIWSCSARGSALEVAHFGGADAMSGTELLGHVRCAR